MAPTSEIPSFEEGWPKAGEVFLMNPAFKPDLTLEGDPQRNQNQFLVLSAAEPFEVLRVEYVTGEHIQFSQVVETALDLVQRLPMFQDTLRKLSQGKPSSGEWPVDLNIQCRRLGSESIVKYRCLLQPCRKPGIFKLAPAIKGKG